MKHKTLQLSEDDLHKPFLTVEACGHEVSVSITQDYTQFGTNTAENMWKSSNEILCVDATVYKAVNSTNSCVLVALGLSDGSIVLYSISTTRCNRFSNFSIAKLIAPVRDISFCSQCCLSAVSAAAECVLVYYDLNVALTALQRTVRVNVELPGLSSTPHSASFEKSVQVTCMYDVGRNTVTTGNGSSSSASAVSAFLNAHCSSTAVAAAAAATTNPASSANNNSRSDTVLLLGCADGSVRWVLTPQTGNVLPLAHMPRLPREVCNNEGCALTEDGGKEGDENEEEPLSVHSALLESFGAPIKALLLGDAPYSDDYSRTAALWVVQEGGACTVLGLRPRLPAGRDALLYICSMTLVELLRLRLS